MTNVLITGGAGFIGVNATNYFAKKGFSVTILDNLSRKGSVFNLKWIRKQFPKIKIIEGDIRNEAVVRDAVKKQDIILHLAGQVAVTTSVEKPFEDFQINALGTLNVLEAVRKSNPKAVLLYSSTNKVYGGMEHETIVKKKTRYAYKHLTNGISEEYQLDFHSPYGCSKGTADQYVRDYARIYDLSTIVFRQSCIYGPHQFGVEDQGWIAWFIIALLSNKAISIYGDGKQVRDILYIDDLIRAYDFALNTSHKTKGNIYNIGGGQKFSISIWEEFKPILEKNFNKQIKAKFANWRPGDQLIYISDIRKAKKDFNWAPQIKPDDGIQKLFLWAKKNKKLFSHFA